MCAGVGSLPYSLDLFSVPETGIPQSHCPIRHMVPIRCHYKERHTSQVGNMKMGIAIYFLHMYALLVTKATMIRRGRLSLMLRMKIDRPNCSYSS